MSTNFWVLKCSLIVLFLKFSFQAEDSSSIDNIETDKNILFDEVMKTELENKRFRDFSIFIQKMT